MLMSIRMLLISLAVTCVCATHSVAAPLVLFDEAHGQRFLIGNSGPLDLSELAALYRANGFEVANHSAPLTREALDGVAMLVLSGPFQPLTDDELEAVAGFIDAGGGLAVMLHVAPIVRDLLFRLEIDFSNGTLRETARVIDGNPLNFEVSAMAEHPVTTGLEGFSVYGAWALRATAPHARILAETGRRSWIDLDHDNRFSERDASQSFGVMVAGELGQGRYAVLGDDALFQNRFLDEANRRLALRLLDWLAAR